MNLRELSDHLGLSQATVSRALNGYTTVNAKTRERVMEEAKRLNYRPNTSARRLATGKAGAFGIVLDQSDDLLNDPHFVDFLSGFTHELASMDLDVVLTAAQGLSTYRRFATTGKVDGFVVSAPKVNDPRILALSEMNFPFVVHGQSDIEAPYAYFDVANKVAFADATRLLINLGHNRIALINGTGDSMFAQERLAGYEQVLKDAGIPIDPTLIHHGPMSEDEGYRQTQILYALAKPPTAILCSSTLQTLGLTRRLREEGLEIGREVSVISHDDGLSSMKTENFSVPLTVTRAPIRTAGCEIAKMLVSLSGGADVSALQRLMPAELIVRASTSAVQKL
ncbi:MAG: LacI family DNA-binding transcriptional regulator [Pseudoruegeria sp.]